MIGRGHIESVNEALIRGVLASAPVTRAIEVPAGHAGIACFAVERAGLDMLSVASWLAPRGGFCDVAYLPSRNDRRDTRAVLQPVPYFSVPVEALAPPAAAA